MPSFTLRSARPYMFLVGMLVLVTIETLLSYGIVFGLIVAVLPQVFYFKLRSGLRSAINMKFDV